MNFRAIEQPPAGQTPGPVDIALAKGLAAIATNLWRAKTKLAQLVVGEANEDVRRIQRHLDAIDRALKELGVTIRDHTGENYDEGQPMRVIASKPVDDLEKKRVSETLLPSIFWNDWLIQNGEIEIATPMPPGN